MEWPEILYRIEVGEDQHTECKSAPGRIMLKTIGKTLCAFANTKGGVLILGVDAMGKIIGVMEDASGFEEHLSSFLENGCSAPINATYGHHQDPKGRVHWVEVPRQRGPKPLSYGDRVWIRRGKASVQPSLAELQELNNLCGYILTEGRRLQNASKDDIDLQAFRLFLEKSSIEIEEDPQPSTEDDLRNRGILEELDGVFYPTLYGMLTFGKRPQDHPQTGNFWVDCVAYAGKDQAAEVLLSGEGKGRLDQQVEHACKWVLGLGMYEKYHGLIREDIPLVPLKALREVLVNAVAHRDYAITGGKILLEVFSDRMDVTSPGTLTNYRTVESVRAGGYSLARNQIIMCFLQNQGLVEQRGRGWPIMRKAMREFNGTEPELRNDEDNKFVRVTFRLDH